MNDLRTRLTLDGSDFNTGMDQSTKKVEDFQKQSSKAANSVKDLGKNAKVSTKELLSEMGKISGAERSMTGYQRKLSQIQKDIQDLTVNYRAMNAEMRNSDVGKQAAQRIQELTIEAAKYKDAVLDARKSVQMLASDTAGWDAAKQGINALSAGLQGVVSAGILGKKSTEDLVEVLAKLKGIEAATNSIITIGNALQRESALMMGIAKVQALALAKAKVVETTATKGATIAQKAFNLVAKANPYVLLATAVIAVGTALFAFTKKTKEATKAQEEENRKIEEGKKRFDEYKTTVGSAVGNVVGKFKSLQKSYKDLTTEMEKKRWIDENKTAFEQLGLKIQNVNDADKIFIQQSEQVIAALKARAKANALQSLYEKEYVKQVEAEIAAAEDLEKAKNTPVKKSGKWQDDWSKAGLGKGDYKSFSSPGSPTVGGSGATTYELTPAGEAKMKAYYENLSKTAGDAMVAETTKTISIIEQKWEDAEKEAAVKEGAVKDLLLDTTKKDDNKPKSDGPEKEYKSQYKQLEAQLKVLEEQKWDIIEGTEEWGKQLAAIQAVKKQMKELEDAEKGYLARLKNAELGPIEKIDSSKFQGRAEVRTKTNEEKVVDYENAVKIGNKYKEQFELGLIDENTYKKFIDNLNKGLAAEGIKAKIGVDIEVKDEDIASIGDKFKSVVEKMDTVGGVARGVVGSINNVYEAFNNLEDTLNDAENGWEQFFAIFQAGLTLFESATTIIEAIGTVMEILNTVRGKGIQKTQQDTQATTQNVLAKQAEAGANITAGATAGIAAGGEAASSVASIPYVGPILAVAAIATVAAAIISLISSLKGFATGGIVGGNSYNGDKVLARLNSGEMVLNQDQQNKLWNMINSGDVNSGSGYGGEVEFTIKGENLVGCLNNYNRKYNRI